MTPIADRCSRIRKQLRQMPIALAVGMVELTALFTIAVVPALAHATLLSASPAPGEVAPATLKQIDLIFDSTLAPGSKLVMFTGNFLPVPGIVSQVEQGRQLSVHLPAPLLPGTYTLQWTAITLDGHSVEGSYQFGVSQTAGSPLRITLSVIAGLSMVLLVIGGWWVVARRHR